jgi:hypothetical protein
MNVHTRIEYINLWVRNIDFDVIEIKGFSFAVQPHSLSHSFVQGVYPVGWTAQSNGCRVNADADDLIAFGQLAFKLELHLHRHLNDWLEANGNRGWLKPLDLDVFGQIHFYTIERQPDNTFARLLVS